MPGEGIANEVEWKIWSKDAFDEARRDGKLVLLDLTASWCHWCHVMDRSTYSNPEIARLINDNFVAVRVDIDRRPDISERYNRGGFPTTAFLSDRGESVWGATYVPPLDMKRIIGSIIQAKRSGEIDKALERNRMPYLDLTKALEPRTPVTLNELDDIFEDVFSTYDVEDGGFGIEPKFPHPDVIDLLLTRYTENKDAEIAEAVVHTLERMTEGLYDEVEGGVFRYSVTRDWRTPHYEKMLETNLGYLRNMVHAYKVTGKDGLRIHAKGVARYLLGTMRDPHTGGFYGSQDADEEYYRMSRDRRKRRTAPSIDRTIYAGWNAEASSIMLMAGKTLQEEEWVKAGLAAWRNIVARLWDHDKKLVRHVVDGEDYLFEDQVAFFKALIAAYHVTGDDSIPGLAEELINAVDKGFANEDGGYSDVMHVDGALGELENPRRSLAENSNWAYALILFGTIISREDLIVKARTILSSFTRKEVDAHGLFGAAYLRARLVLELGPLTVDVHARPENVHDPLELCSAAMSLVHPAVVVRRVSDEHASRPFAVVCSGERCLPRTEDPSKLLETLGNLVAERGR
jgi:uncharacterized protein YyaL (SSP411 family)